MHLRTGHARRFQWRTACWFLLCFSLPAGPKAARSEIDLSWNSSDATNATDEEEISLREQEFLGPPALDPAGVSRGKAAVQVRLAVPEHVRCLAKMMDQSLPSAEEVTMNFRHGQPHVLGAASWVVKVPVPPGADVRITCATTKTMLVSGSLSLQTQGFFSWPHRKMPEARTPIEGAMKVGAAVRFPDVVRCAALHGHSPPDPFDLFTGKVSHIGQLSEPMFLGAQQLGFLTISGMPPPKSLAEARGTTVWCSTNNSFVLSNPSKIQRQGFVGPPQVMSAPGVSLRLSVTVLLDETVRCSATVHCKVEENSTMTCPNTQVSSTEKQLKAMEPTLVYIAGLSGSGSYEANCLTLETLELSSPTNFQMQSLAAPELLEVGATSLHVKWPAAFHAEPIRCAATKRGAPTNATYILGAGVLPLQMSDSSIEAEGHVLGLTPSSEYEVVCAGEWSKSLSAMLLAKTATYLRQPYVATSLEDLAQGSLAIGVALHGDAACCSQRVRCVAMISNEKKPSVAEVLSGKRHMGFDTLGSVDPARMLVGGSVGIIRLKHLPLASSIGIVCATETTHVLSAVLVVPTQYFTVPLTFVPPATPFSFTVKIAAAVDEEVQCTAYRSSSGIDDSCAGWCAGLQWCRPEDKNALPVMNEDNVTDISGEDNVTKITETNSIQDECLCSRCPSGPSTVRSNLTAGTVDQLLFANLNPASEYKVYCVGLDSRLEATIFNIATSGLAPTLCGGRYAAVCPLSWTGGSQNARAIVSVKAGAEASLRCVALAIGDVTSTTVKTTATLVAADILSGSAAEMRSGVRVLADSGLRSVTPFVGQQIVLNGLDLSSQTTQHHILCATSSSFALGIAVVKNEFTTLRTNVINSSAVEVAVEVAISEALYCIALLSTDVAEPTSAFVIGEGQLAEVKGSKSFVVLTRPERKDIDIFCATNVTTIMSKPKRVAAPPYFKTPLGISHKVVGATARVTFTLSSAAMVRCSAIQPGQNFSSNVNWFSGDIKGLAGPPQQPMYLEGGANAFFDLQGLPESSTVQVICATADSVTQPLELQRQGMLASDPEGLVGGASISVKLTFGSERVRCVMALALQRVAGNNLDANDVMKKENDAQWPSWAGEELVSSDESQRLHILGPTPERYNMACITARTRVVSDVFDVVVPGFSKQLKLVDSAPDELVIRAIITVDAEVRCVVVPAAASAVPSDILDDEWMALAHSDVALLSAGQPTEISFHNANVTNLSSIDTEVVCASSDGALSPRLRLPFYTPLPKSGNGNSTANGTRFVASHGTNEASRSVEQWQVALSYSIPIVILLVSFCLWRCLAGCCGAHRRPTQTRQVALSVQTSDDGRAAQSPGAMSPLNNHADEREIGSPRPLPDHFRHSRDQTWNPDLFTSTELDNAADTEASPARGLSNSNLKHSTSMASSNAETQGAVDKPNLAGGLKHSISMASNKSETQGAADGPNLFSVLKHSTSMASNNAELQGAADGPNLFSTLRHSTSMTSNNIENQEKSKSVKSNLFNTVPAKGSERNNREAKIHDLLKRTISGGDLGRSKAEQSSGSAETESKTQKKGSGTTEDLWLLKKGGQKGDDQGQGLGALFVTAPAKMVLGETRTGAEEPPVFKKPPDPWDDFFSTRKEEPKDASRSSSPSSPQRNRPQTETKILEEQFAHISQATPSAAVASVAAWAGKAQALSWALAAAVEEGDSDQENDAV